MKRKKPKLQPKLDRHFTLLVSDGPLWRKFMKRAKERGLRPQAMIRAVVIPEWLVQHVPLPSLVGRKKK